MSEADISAVGYLLIRIRSTESSRILRAQDTAEVGPPAPRGRTDPAGHSHVGGLRPHLRRPPLHPRPRPRRTRGGPLHGRAADARARHRGRHPRPTGPRRSRRTPDLGLDALPGATHDLTAARAHGIPAALAADNIKCWADKAYQGAGQATRPLSVASICAAGADVTTRTTRKSAASVNAPWRSSSPGGSCGSSAAAPRGSQLSSEPSSPSNSPPDQDARGSMTTVG